MESKSKVRYAADIAWIMRGMMDEGRICEEFPVSGKTAADLIIELADVFEKRYYNIIWEKEPYNENYKKEITAFAVESIEQYYKAPSRDIFCSYKYIDEECGSLSECKKCPAREKRAKYLWNQFQNVPVDPDTGELLEDWRMFQAGTHFMEVWGWFSEQFHLPIEKFPKKEIDLHQLAVDIDKYYRIINPYEYADTVDSTEKNILEVEWMLANKNESVLTSLQEYANECRDMEDSIRAIELVKRVKKAYA